MLKIGDFSKLSRLSVRMLRHYDERGLLVPLSTDPFTGYRYYAEEQLAAAAHIAALRAMGFSLAEISALARQPDRDRLMEALAARRAQEAAALEDARHRLRLLDTALQRLQKEGTAMKYDVTIKTLPERQVASVRMTLPAYEMEGTLWGTLVQETAPLHLVEDDPCLCTVLFHDEGWKESHVDLEAQKTVRGSYPDTEHVRFKTMPPVTFASAIHRGSYDTLNEVYPAVGAWVLDNGYTLAEGPVFNIYHVSPHETDNPEEFVTEVCYPIRQK